MARRTAEAKATIPHFYVQRHVQMGEALTFRTHLKSAVTVNDLVVRACGLALPSHPALRRSWTEQGFVSHEHTSIGIAVALEDGALIVPVVRNVAQLPLIEMTAQASQLLERTRLRRLDAAEMGDAIMTVSNLGMLGVASFAAIINPPEAAVLAVGAIEPYLTLIDSVVVQTSRMTLTLSVDHRVCAGVEAARFLADVGGRLESPEGLV